MEYSAVIRWMLDSGRVEDYCEHGYATPAEAARAITMAARFRDETIFESYVVDDCGNIVEVP